MRYTICTIRPAAFAVGGREDGVIFPLPGAMPDTVALEARDGHAVRQAWAREITVKVVSAREPLLHADDVRAQIYITDARVALACTKYDTGGGWIGGPIALALNTASRVRAARRRRGMTLVGHVRYPWLRGVYARNASGLRGSELVRLIVEGDDRPIQCDLVLRGGASATEVATEIIRRAARFRLDHDDDATTAQRAELEQLAELAPLRWAKGDQKLAGRDLPTSWPPTTRSARLGAEQASEPAPHATLVGRAPPAAAADDVTVVLRRRAPEDDDLDVKLRPRSPDSDQP